MENKIVRIKEVDTEAARMEGTRAIIKVRFVSEQENILREADGKIIGGEEGRLEEVTDVWSFSREASNTGGEWILAETHE